MEMSMARYARRPFAALLLCCSLVFSLTASAFDLRSTDPSKLLDLLVNGNFPRAVLTIDEPVQNWVQERDLPNLMLLLDSPVPCAPVALSRSSSWPDVSSLGDQAAFLIQGFRAGVYPPALQSAKMKPGEKDEIRAWWLARKTCVTTKGCFGHPGVT